MAKIGGTGIEKGEPVSGDAKAAINENKMKKKANIGVPVTKKAEEICEKMRKELKGG